MQSCEFHITDEGQHRCGYCGRMVVNATPPIYAMCSSARSPPKTSGRPGTELTAIFNELGVVRLEGCQCQARSSEMNAWGLAGCREHFDEIVAWLREGQEQFGWRDKLAAAAKAVTSGLALKVNWADPFPGLVTLAIKRAEEKAATAQSDTAPPTETDPPA